MKQFKSVIPYRHEVRELVAAVDGDLSHLKALQTVMANHPIVDPQAGEWGRIGFLGNEHGDMYYANETAIMLMVSIRERILPGPVLKAEVERRAARLAERQGRPCHRKEYAQLREDAEAFMLPKSHIKETFIPVILRQKWMMVCTPSHKRADEVVMLMMRAFGTNAIRAVETVQSPEAWMTELAVNGQDDNTELFFPGESITLLGHDAAKGTVSFRDEDVTSHRVSDLITSEGYTATKMQVCMENLRFTLSPSMVLSGIKFESTFLESRVNQDKDDARAVFDSNLTMVALEYHELLKQLVTSLGGLKPVAEAEEEPADTSTGDEPTGQGDADENTEATPGGEPRLLKFWINEGRVPHFFYTRSDQPDPDDDSIQVTRNEFELEGGDVSEEDEAWLAGNDDFAAAKEATGVTEDEEDDETL